MKHIYQLNLCVINHGANDTDVLPLTPSRVCAITLTDPESAAVEQSPQSQLALAGARPPCQELQ